MKNYITTTLLIISSLILAFISAVILNFLMPPFGFTENSYKAIAGISGIFTYGYYIILRGFVASRKPNRSSENKTPTEAAEGSWNRDGLYMGLGALLFTFMGMLLFAGIITSDDTVSTPKYDVLTYKYHVLTWIEDHQTKDGLEQGIKVYQQVLLAISAGSFSLIGIMLAAFALVSSTYRDISSEVLKTKKLDIFSSFVKLVAMLILVIVLSLNLYIYTFDFHFKEKIRIMMVSSFITLLVFYLALFQVLELFKYTYEVFSNLLRGKSSNSTRPRRRISQASRLSRRRRYGR